MYKSLTCHVMDRRIKNKCFWLLNNLGMEQLTENDTNSVAKG